MKGVWTIYIFVHRVTTSEFKAVDLLYDQSMGSNSVVHSPGMSTSPISAIPGPIQWALRAWIQKSELAITPYVLSIGSQPNTLC